jgi:hypothetical protein
MSKAEIIAARASLAGYYAESIGASVARSVAADPSQPAAHRAAASRFVASHYAPTVSPAQAARNIARARAVAEEMSAAGEFDI